MPGQHAIGGPARSPLPGIPLKTIKVTADPPSISAALPFGTIRDNAEAALPADAIRALLPRHGEIPGLFRGNPQVLLVPNGLA